jgi:hypothetical protein
MTIRRQIGSVGLNSQNRLVHRVLQHRRIATLFRSVAMDAAPSGRTPGAATGAADGPQARRAVVVEGSAPAESAGEVPVIAELVPVQERRRASTPQSEIETQPRPAWQPAPTLQAAPQPPTASRARAASPTPTRSSSARGVPASTGGPQAQTPESAAQEETTLTDQVWQRLQTIFRRHQEAQQTAAEPQERRAENAAHIAAATGDVAQEDVGESIPQERGAPTRSEAPVSRRGEHVADAGIVELSAQDATSRDEERASGGANPTPSVPRRTTTDAAPQAVAFQQERASGRPQPPLSKEAQPEALAPEDAAPDTQTEAATEIQRSPGTVFPAVTQPAAEGVEVARPEGVPEEAPQGRVAREAEGTMVTPDDSAVGQTEAAATVIGPSQTGRESAASGVTTARAAATGEIDNARPPLSQVWQVERIVPAYDDFVAAQAASGRPPEPERPGATTSEAGPSPVPIGATDEAAQYASERLAAAETAAILQQVAAGRPTRSSIEHLPPRRPRPRVPAPTAQAAGRTTPSADRVVAADVARRATPAPPTTPTPPHSEGGVRAAPARSATANVTTRDKGASPDEAASPDRSASEYSGAANGGGAAENIRAAEAVVETEIGPLPRDLWTLIGERPPERPARPPYEAPQAAEEPQTAAPRAAAAAPAPTPAAMVPAAGSETAARPAPGPVIQRTPVAWRTPVARGSIRPALAEAATSPDEAVETPTASMALQQESGDETAGEAEATVVDIETLAQRVYADLKRRLAVEWERLRGL